MRAMILAAGRGERMRPLTDHTPKALLEVAGRPLIEHHLYRLAQGGFEEVVINLAHLGGQIRERLGSGEAYGLSIRYSDEGHSALETGGGLFRALPLLGRAPFLALNADIWCERPLRPIELRAGDLAHLILVDNPAHNPQGDFALTGERLRNQGQDRLTFSGIGYYHPELFCTCTPGRFPLAPLLRAAAQRDRAGGEHYAGPWSDIGTPQRLEALNRQYSRLPRPPQVR